MGLLQGIGGGHGLGCHGLCYGRAAMEFERFYLSLWAELCCVGSKQPKSTSRQQSFALTWWLEGTAQGLLS